MFLIHQHTLCHLKVAEPIDILSLLSPTRGGAKEPLKWQIDTGEGFLRDAPDDVMGDMMGSGMALAKAWRPKVRT